MLGIFLEGNDVMTSRGFGEWRRGWDVRYGEEYITSSNDLVSLFSTLFCSNCLDSKGLFYQIMILFCLFLL